MTKLVIAVVCLLNVSKIEVSTASEAKYAASMDTLLNLVEETTDSDITISPGRKLIDCQKLHQILSYDQKCRSHNNLFFQLILLKGQGAFGEVWKVSYSTSPVREWWADERFAANEIGILMKMYQDRVKHVTKIIPDLTTNISTVDVSLTANETDSTKWIMIGMEYYDIDLDWYTIKTPRTSKFDAHLLVSNLMVCTVYQFILL